MNPAPAQMEPPNTEPGRLAANSTRPDQLSRNLAALAEVDPRLAERLGRPELADHFVPAVGRDGSPTLKRKHPDRTVSWLGRTSMPTVSGPALLESFDHAGGNIAFHGIGQGFELVLLTRRMEPRQTLFVLEPDLPAVVGALALHDVSAALRSRQIVLLVDQDTSDQLLQFLLDHPGFEAPGCFLQWPWQSPVEIARFKSALEDLHRVLAEHRRGPIAELTSRVQRLAAAPREVDISQWLVISRRHDPTTAAVAEDLVAAADSLGWSTSQVDWHHPGQTSPLALLTEVDRVNPQFILLLNELRGQMGTALPPGIPVVSWFLEPRHTAALGGARPGPQDLVLAESPATANRLIKAGIKPDRLVVLPPGAGAEADHQGPDRPPEPRGQDWDVACFADAVDLSAEARGIELSALAAIWKATVAALAHGAEQAEAGNLERILDGVAKRGHLRMTDQPVREDLVGRLEFDAAETILAKHYLKALMDAGLRVRLWGQGWEAEPSLGEVWAGERPDPRDLPQLLARSPLVLDCCVRERLDRGTLSAILIGAVPLVRGRFPVGPSPGTKTPGWPKDYCPARIGLPTYMRAGQLVKQVSELIRDPNRRAGLAEKLKTLVLTQHLTTHRLRSIARLMIERAT